LSNQERFKNLHPEKTMKPNESPTKSDLSKISVSIPANPRSAHHQSNKSIPVVPVMSRKIEPVGPVNANLGRPTDYMAPNPILTPVSDLLANPYVRREVNNSLFDSKTKAIY
jgi:hypothetical protein